MRHSIYVHILQNEVCIIFYRSSKGFMNLRIKRDPSTRDFLLASCGERRFMTVPHMVHHYARNRLPIKGAEHACLREPVREQML